MLVVDSLTLPQPDSRYIGLAVKNNKLRYEVTEKLQRLRSVLLVYGSSEPSVNLIHACMRYRRVMPIAARDLDVFNTLKYDTVVLDADAVVVLEEMLGRTAA